MLCRNNYDKKTYITYEDIHIENASLKHNNIIDFMSSINRSKIFNNHKYFSYLNNITEFILLYR